MSFIMRWKWAGPAVVVWLLLGWLGSPHVRAQKDKELAGDVYPTPVEPTTASKLYYGVAACQGGSCHDGKPPVSWVDGKQVNVRCDELIRWKKYDKHDNAFLSLQSPRGKRMGQLLGYDPDPKTWKTCLTCHAVWIGDDKLEKASKEVNFKVEEGVNCVACHGHYEEWVPSHSILVTARKFRPLSRSEKWSKYGMIDLKDPLKRAELCASCHVGNMAQEKFVTHEMYAAGHPPLPSFELATFSNEMPRHWQLLREKSPALQKEIGLSPGELEETKLLLIGAAVALRDNMRLLQADAVSNHVKNGDGLDIAHFDCYACHHDLKADSWRLKRGYDKNRKPGRVGLRPWSVELVKLAIAADEKTASTRSAEYEKLVADLNKVFDSRPYGNPTEVAAAAKKLDKFAHELALSLSSPKRIFKVDDTTRLLKAIPTIYEPATKLYDYDSARQISWAHEILKKELVRIRIPGEVQEDNSNLVAVDVELKGINDLLRLRLPRKSTGESLSSEYQTTLERISKWDPFRARSVFASFK
ncbi:MAG: hypothetical protein EBV06_05085 [Planctomycetia bacterium]|nr:hypothetical protein [Planctomycetia bacterium]